jgi:site-specific DNA recombinase
VGELKKKKYVYYHCTGHRGKCPEPYTREEAMQDQFGESLRELTIPLEVLVWLQEAVAESDLTERGAHEREVKRLEEQLRRLESKLDTLYEDRLESRIPPEMYDRKSPELRVQRLELLRRLNEVRAASRPAAKTAINLMDLTSRAADLFLVRPAHEKQRFMRLVLKSASWQQGRLRTEFEEPFESLRRSNQLSTAKHKENRMPNLQIENWLPGMDSNHDSRLQRPLSYH